MYIMFLDLAEHHTLDERNRHLRIGTYLAIPIEKLTK